MEENLIYTLGIVCVELAIRGTATALMDKASESQIIICHAKQLQPYFDRKEEPVKDIKTRSNHIRLPLEKNLAIAWKTSWSRGYFSSTGRKSKGPNRDSESSTGGKKVGLKETYNP